MYEYKVFLVFFINENRSDVKNNKRKKNQSQRIAERIEIRSISSDSGALQIRKKMLARMGKARSSGSGCTKVLGLLGTKEILEVLMQMGT